MESEIKEWVKKYWWVILIILLLPFVINVILLMPAFFPIVGENTDWLSFWGCYLGAIISAGVAFIILGVQYQQNNTENSKNRQLQISVLKYQQERDQLQFVIKILSELVTLIDPIEVGRLCNQFGINETNIFSKIDSLVFNLEKYHQELSVYIDTDNSLSNKNLQIDINSSKCEFFSMLLDIKFLFNSFCKYTNELKIDDFKKDSILSEKISEKMQTIILQYDKQKTNYLSLTDCRSIAKIRVESVLDLQDRFQQQIKDYVKKEKERIEKLLIL